MDELSSYNLAINSAKSKLAIIQKELSEAIKERDRVYEDIRDQRNSSSIVNSEVIKKEKEKYSTIEQLEVISKSLKKSRNDFENTVDKENNTIKQLDTIISERILQEKQHKDRTEELSKISNTIISRKTELDNINLSIHNGKEELKNTELRIRDENDKLDIRENKVKEQEENISRILADIETKESLLSLRQRRIDNMYKTLNK